MPLEATLAALDECRRAGKIRHIGVCNFGIEDLRRAVATGVRTAEHAHPAPSVLH